MQIIRPTLSPYDQLLGKQKANEHSHYRLMTFVVQQPINDGILFYNTMTKALVLLSQDESRLFLSNPINYPELIGLWFAVPDRHDDILLSKQFTKVAHMLAKPAKGITGYTILTTTDCNARCFYCYEKGIPRISMNQETAKNIAHYIIRHCMGKPVSLGWFGGEPLYNKTVISTICRILFEAGIKYHSKMISNGYLMDSDTINEATELWNLKQIQITLDGTEQIYNRCKSYIYNNGSAYKRVMNNIQLLLDNNIRVKIRLNIDLHNADDLFRLLEELHQKFNGMKGLSIYSHALFGNYMKSAAINSDNERRLIFDKQNQLATLIKDYGFSKPSKLSNEVKTLNCMADNDRCIVILPTGRIGKCEHFSDDNMIGDISQESFNQDIIEAYKVFRKDKAEECHLCALYPQCTFLEKCNTRQHCYPEEREQILSKIKQGMVLVYKEFKHNKQ